MSKLEVRAVNESFPELVKPPPQCNKNGFNKFDGNKPGKNRTLHNEELEKLTSLPIGRGRTLFSSETVASSLKRHRFHREVV